MSDAIPSAADVAMTTTDDTASIVSADELIDSQATAMGLLPFSYAKAHGVLLERDGDARRVFYRSPLATATLLELNRYVREGFELIESSADAFQQRLTRPTSERTMKPRRWPRTLVPM